MSGGYDEAIMVAEKDDAVGTFYIYKISSSIDTSPYNMRLVFTADQKGTLDFAGRQLWMQDSVWKFWKNFGKGGSEGIGFLNGLV